MPIHESRPQNSSHTAQPGESARAHQSPTQLFERLEQLSRSLKTLRAQGMNKAADESCHVMATQLQSLFGHVRGMKAEEASAWHQRLAIFLTSNRPLFSDIFFRAQYHQLHQLLESLPHVTAGNAKARADDEVVVAATAAPKHKAETGAASAAKMPAPSKAKQAAAKFANQVKRVMPTQASSQAASVGSPVNGNETNTIKRPWQETLAQANKELARQVAAIRVNTRSGLKFKPFRVSVLESPGLPPLFVGSAIASGGFAKVVPVVYRDNDGRYCAAVAKVVRRIEVRNAEKKSRTNRFGSRRNQVGTHEMFAAEKKNMELLGGAVKVLGERTTEKEFYLIMTAMDSSLSEAVYFASDKDLSMLARDAVPQIARHLADIVHKQEYVHGDLKTLNALVDFHKRTVALSDFGGAKKISQPNERVNPALTFLSPEAAAGAGMSYKHDVYQLGILALDLLNGGVDDLSQFLRIGGGDPERARALHIENLQRVALFREKVLISPDSTRVDLKKLREETNTFSGTASMFRDAAGRDPELTAYIIGSLLHPDENQRPTAAQAARELSKFSPGPLRRPGRIYDTIDKNTASMREAHDKLFAIAPVILKQQRTGSVV